ncbi:hypothetical protein COO91_04383 [Nostoc flagelliforme CCNUN1]|uniref:Uncharacterized protein n=2 Tax=Nostoc flagelliforme TaxID=1306274 RepID=A0A2K8SSW8_9NOSO|nr:hypothetical protein COO91_04383 [Nostoc flagelliforme CCNUN1]
MPDFYRFTNIQLKVSIYKIFLRAFILIVFMVAGYFRQATCALIGKTRPFAFVPQKCPYTERILETAKFFGFSPPVRAYFYSCSERLAVSRFKNVQRPKL